MQSHRLRWRSRPGVPALAFAARLALSFGSLRAGGALDADAVGFSIADAGSSLKLPCTRQLELMHQAEAAGAGGILTVSLPGLLGNLMFAVAALEGIADKLHRPAHLSVVDSLHKTGPEAGGDTAADELSARRLHSFAAAFGLQFCEAHALNSSWHDLNFGRGWGRYDEGIDAAGIRRVSDADGDAVPSAVRVTSSFARHFFEHLPREKLRRLFRFPPPVASKAQAFLQASREEYARKAGLAAEQLRLVGVHVRRGDKNWEYHLFNEWSHGAPYISRAMQVVHRLFHSPATQGRHVLFVVTSDDHQWVRDSFRLPNMVLSPFVTTPECKMAITCDDPLVDMAILSMCDAVVVSGSSTYSWWAAYLSADTSVTIAPRLPVNPQGPFGPCASTGREGVTDAAAHTALASAQSCGVTGGSAGLMAARGIGVWVAGRRTHAECQEFWSHDYYPDDWILLDEDPGLDVFPEWWGPDVTALTLLPDQLSTQARGLGDAVDIVAVAARLVNLPPTGRVCVYIDGAVAASLPAHGSGHALFQLTLAAPDPAVPVKPAISATESKGCRVAVCAIAGGDGMGLVDEEGGCPVTSHLDTDCALSLTEISVPPAA